MKAVINEETCVGCGICFNICPDVFEASDNIAIVKVDEIPENLQESAKNAAEDCPVDAILIEG